MSKSLGRPSQEQLLQSFAIHESEQQIQTPGMVYSELLATVHERLCRQWDIPAVEAAHRRSVNPLDNGQLSQTPSRLYST
jgi:hypothetical protein